MPETVCAELNTRLHGEQIRRFLQKNSARRVSRNRVRSALGISSQQLERAIEWLTFENLQVCEDDDGYLYWRRMWEVNYEQDRET